MLEFILMAAMSVFPMSMFDFWCTSEKGANTVLVQCCAGSYSCTYKICNLKKDTCREYNPEN